MSEHVKFTNPDSVAPPYGPYSHVAKVAGGSGIVFLSGQVGERRDGSIPETIEEQYLETVRTIAAMLEAEGLDPANIVKLTTYVTEPIDPVSLREARRSAFGDIVPAATMLFVPRLLHDDYKVEIEAIVACAA